MDSIITDFERRRVTAGNALRKDSIDGGVGVDDGTTQASGTRTPLAMKSGLPTTAGGLSTTQANERVATLPNTTVGMISAWESMAERDSTQL